MTFTAGQRVTASSLNTANLLGTTPTATNSSGTATSGTTDTMDAVLGNYQPVLVAGNRYLIVLNGLLGNGSVVADRFSVRIRVEESAATPTTSSAACAENSWYCSSTGSAGRTGILLSDTYVPTVTGVHTFAFFAQRVTGTGVFTPVSGDLGVSRELYALSVGTV